MSRDMERLRAAQTLAEQGMAHHRQGDTIAAERLYREALALDPEAPDALHGLGVLALERGLPAQAIALIGRASGLRPDHALFTLNLGHALLARGHFEEARAAMRAATLQDPGDPRAHAALAGVLEQLGRLDEALTAARTALDRVIDSSAIPGTQALAGRAASALGRWPDAVSALSRAVAENPADAASWHGLAVAHAALGRSDEAERCFREVAALLPDDPAAIANLGGRLWENNKLDEALAALRRADALGPPTAETASNLGLVLLALGHLDEAERRLAEAARLAPDRAGILVNHGTALLELNRFDDAERCFAEVEHRHAGTLDAERARFNRATLLLGTGRFAEGWAGFEARHAVLGRSPSALPSWDGGPLDPSVPLLIEAEQGLGDVIQFLRYVPEAMRRASIVLRLPDPLHRLARDSLPSECRVIGPADPEPGGAVRAALLSLPLLLGIPEPFFPGAYLQAEPGRTTGLIGLCWSGSPAYRFDRRRSLPLAQLAPLAAADRHFVALQPDRLDETPPEGMALSRSALRDLADTAALIATCSLVVTVDTAVAHLAGALDRPTLLLNRFGGDWRWRRANRDAEGRSLWYPSVRVLDQDEPGSPERVWIAVIERAAAMLDG
ncbi:tetratricopeptide repeat protein [Acetobacteraceae bacterium KSS8]|uniref:Tetratricopeptide repeat protein n=1 Tax=Endosaccharibacter trunci TaxID=2812733 RepID=A0ABT1W4K5_9PROT|nr:tetratricopeptide repeat protein [Acetobacteraceae bacterium KSS8]